ncbi:hypothetical protein HA466_0218680 [Hirschfeldia incana]|nr:hypothetical protein HA466_0218680 [Hirschfeldia incana]
MACVVSFHGGSLWFAMSRCRSGRLWLPLRRCGKSSSFGSVTFGSQSFTGSGAAVVSDPLCVVGSRLGVFGLSLSSVLAMKIRCTVRFYGVLSSVSVFGLPIFIRLEARGSGMFLCLSSFRSMSFKSVERTSSIRSS